jgi:hypothetical protein
MTTVATRARRIADIEGFDLIIKRGGKPVPAHENGTIGPYPYEKMANSKWTIAEWKSKRFEANYDGFTCDVLLEDGSLAYANMSLNGVRLSYEG